MARCSLRARARVLAIAVLTVAALVNAPVAQAAHHSGWTTVARGFDNPRGVALLPHGELVVAESGHSGTTCVFGGKVCGGLTAGITGVNLQNGQRRALVRGLPSMFLPFASFGLGGLSVRNGQLYAVTAANPQFLGSPAADCAGLPAPCLRVIRAVKSRSGLLIRVRPGGGFDSVGAVGAADYRYTVVANPSPGNPDFQPGDADPFGLLTGPNGTYVADGGSNTLSFVRPDGHVRVLAYIPDPPAHQPLYDAVPTCVARVGDSIYVGSLIGSLFRWHAGHLSKVLSGGKLKAIVGCASDPAGNLYVVNLTEDFNNFNPKPSSGSIVKLDRHLHSSYVVAPGQGLNYPGGIGFGPHGALFVSINSLCPRDLSVLPSVGIPPSYCPANGTVVRIER